MVVDKVMYYVYTMGVVMMMYHKEVFHVEVYCEDMYCEGVYYVKYVVVLVDYYKVYCEADYYKVDNWVQEVEILVLDRMMGSVTTVCGFADCFLGQCGEGHVVREEEDILEERFPFLNLRSRDVAHEVLGTLCSCSKQVEMGGTPATATVISGETSQ